MKWVFYVIVFVYMAYRAVYGAKAVNEVSIDKINYGNDTFWRPETRQTINCRASNRNQRLEWLDPSGKVIKRVPTNRVFSQEHFMTNPSGGRAPALVLAFTDLQVKDSGIYKCRSGTKERSTPVCVMKPSEFIDTPTEVFAHLGRSITLTCQAKGDPEPNLYWMRNFHEISEGNNSSKYRLNTKYNSQGFESLLTITSLEPEDSKVVYTCASLQESESACYNEAYLNITLQVSHAPQFENGNATKAVYGKPDDIVDLVCSASGYPPPTYRWFKVVSDDTLAEFDRKQIKFSEEENQAVLSVTAGPTTFEQTYKCVASNSYGSTEKNFTLLKMNKPEKPSKVKFVDSTDKEIQFNITWFDDIDFPVEGFQVQYLRTKRKPSTSDWRKAIEVFKVVDMDFYDQFLGFQVTIEELDEDTSYWARVKVINGAGESSWSEPAIGVTDVKSEESEEVTTEESDKPVAAEVSSDSTFYGIFFAGGIAVVAVVCMFAMRLV